jgi:thioredoxin 1
MSSPKSWLLILVLLVSGGVLKSSTEPLYDERADARRDISAALAQAAHAKKNVVLIFGANW